MVLLFSFVKYLLRGLPPESNYHLEIRRYVSKCSDLHVHVKIFLNYWQKRILIKHLTTLFHTTPYIQSAFIKDFLASYRFLNFIITDELLGNIIIRFL